MMVKAKHIDIKYLVKKKYVKDKTMIIEYVKIELLIAKPLTKGMPQFKFKNHIERMALSSLI